MADQRITNEYCTVTTSGGVVVLANFYDGARVETPHTITKASSLNVIPAGNVPPLPITGEWCSAGCLYSYENAVVCCIQSHYRTIYPPAQTPALFSVYRANTSGLAWIENELVQVNWERTYQGTVYKVLQQHMTQQSWNPVATLGVLWSVAPVGNAWAIGVAYKVNDIVTYQGHTYKCLQAHTSQAGWTPPAVPALWQLIS